MAYTTVFLSFWTDRSKQKSVDLDQSDHGPHCLKFNMYLLEALCFSKSNLFKVYCYYRNSFCVQKIGTFTVYKYENKLVTKLYRFTVHASHNQRNELLKMESLFKRK